MKKKQTSQDFKKVLNPSQWDAVSTIDGPLLVVAGAGTGKTRVIEYRCLYMIQQGIRPEPTGNRTGHISLPPQTAGHLDLTGKNGAVLMPSKFLKMQKRYFRRKMD